MQISIAAAFLVTAALPNSIGSSSPINRKTPSGFVTEDGEIGSSSSPPDANILRKKPRTQFQRSSTVEQRKDPQLAAHQAAVEAAEQVATQAAQQAAAWRAAQKNPFRMATEQEAIQRANQEASARQATQEAAEKTARQAGQQASAWRAFWYARVMDGTQHADDQHLLNRQTAAAPQQALSPNLDVQRQLHQQARNQRLPNQHVDDYPDDWLTLGMAQPRGE